MKHRPYNCFIYSPEFTVEQRQEFPEIDPSKFKESAEAFSQLMADGSLMLDELSQSDELAFEVMEAAQVNDINRVQELLQATGVTHDLDVEFTPSGITLRMRTSANAGNCCVLTMLLKW
ncbi:hypothetical protein [Alkalibacillus haloalkaliphilus]|uniref:Uncharacterized protein n=1 Tax=Alkalibacillus haloalkaliphilus TaxID=94136 RepID=A0A511W912_9BACI|nr:hypothetical protein [Alkalibacillus haloalkaliphilus]GEN45832.1 hypothetical protein AHA02nite_16080 [Alkalibacillus haloalkaliphilus]